MLTNNGASRPRAWIGRLLQVPVLLAIVIVLAIAVLVVRGLVTPATLTKNKDAVGVISDLVTLALVVVGAVLAYYKFFRGRTLAEKLEIKLTTGLVERSGGGLLHWLEIELTNKGSVTIRDPEVRVTAFLHDPDMHGEPVARSVPVPGKAQERPWVIDPGESVYHHVFHDVGAAAEAVSFRVQVEDRAGNVWWRSVTTANRPSKQA